MLDCGTQDKQVVMARKEAELEEEKRDMETSALAPPEENYYTSILEGMEVNAEDF